MIHVTAVDSSPIFVMGAAKLISGVPDMCLAVQSSDEALDQPVNTDVYLIDPCAVTGVTPQNLVETLASVAPVLVVMWSSDTSELGASLRRCGVRGVIDRRASPETLLSAIRDAADGTAAARVEAADDHRLPDGGVPEEQTGLSQREEQVLHLISRGMTHHQTATVLGISPHTVDTYVKRIRAKLGLGNKAELARMAILRGMFAATVPLARQR